MSFDRFKHRADILYKYLNISEYDLKVNYKCKEYRQLKEYISSKNPYNLLISKIVENEKLNVTKMKEWIENQPNIFFRDLAKKFTNTIRFISKYETIQQFEKCANYYYENHKHEYSNKCIILLGDDSTKSTYYLGVLLAAYIFKKYRQLPHSFQSHIYCKQFTKFKFVEIDDMFYTGTQFGLTLKKITDNITFGISKQDLRKHNFACSANLSNQELDAFNYYAAHKLFKIHYDVIPLFITTDAIDLIERSKIFLLQFKLCDVSEIIYSPIELFSNTECFFISTFFNLSILSSSTAFLTYKIADLGSAFLFCFRTGYIPSSIFIKKVIDLLKTGDYDTKLLCDFECNENELLKYVRDNYYQIVPQTNHEMKFIPFVEGCKNFTFENEFEFQTNYGILKNMVNDDEDFAVNDKVLDDLNNKLKCKPFYKQRNVQKKIRRRKYRSYVTH